MKIPCMTCTHNPNDAVRACHHCARPLCKNHVFVVWETTLQDDRASQSGLTSRLRTGTENVAGWEKLKVIRPLLHHLANGLEKLETMRTRNDGIPVYHCRSCNRSYHDNKGQPVT